MTLRGHLVSGFPALHLGLCLFGLAAWIHTRQAEWMLWIGFFLYLFPPLCFRVHQLCCPVRDGLHPLDQPGYSPWWGSLQMQGLYNACPALEAMLRLFPGVYSAWLRLWGSRVGRGVLWTPRVEVSDRGMMEIGRGVVFGHRVACYGHIVDRRKTGVKVLVKKIKIGDGAFIGAGSRLGPGAVIEAGAVLKVESDVGIGERVSEG